PYPGGRGHPADRPVHPSRRDSAASPARRPRRRTVRTSVPGPRPPRRPSTDPPPPAGYGSPALTHGGRVDRWWVGCRDPHLAGSPDESVHAADGGRADEVPDRGPPDRIHPIAGGNRPDDHGG